jgi:[acyl-carrier-protein] S-malonyltransferase
MAAILKLSDSEVAALCSEFENVYPVNFNCDGQVVVAGAKPELDPFMLRVKEAGGRAMPLKTGGGFHSPFMSGASKDFANILAAYDIGTPLLPLYSNVTAKPYEGDFRELLTMQICSPVLWRAAVENMISAGADIFIEVGPGKTLCGLVARISDKVHVFNVEDCESLERTCENICILKGK